MSTWTTKFRAPILGLTIAAAVAAALPAHAAEKKASKQENIGVASGAIVGAAAAGPVGAIIGAAAGAWMGDRYHRQAVKNAALQADLGKTEAERKRLTGNVIDLNHSLVDSQARLEKTIASSRDLEADIGFRTADWELNPDAVEKLKKLGVLASSLPAGTKVRISGYADPRGSKKFNEALSERRAETVAYALLEAGVPSDRMVIEGFGEESSKSVAGDLDGYAFERRVTVRIEKAENEKVASAQ